MLRPARHPVRGAVRHGLDGSDALWSGMPSSQRRPAPPSRPGPLRAAALVAAVLGVAVLGAALAQDLVAPVPAPVDLSAERYAEVLEDLLASPSGRAFLDALLLIEREYLYGFDRDALLQGATAGLVAALGDPFSRYLDPGTVEARRLDPRPEEAVTRATLGDVGYLGVASFEADGIGGVVSQALDAHLAAGARGILLDLRGNAGGSILQGLQVLDRFIADGVLGFRRVRGVSVPIAYANPRSVPQPLVVLVDEQTASTAEIVAGALQAYGRAQLVGSVTAGKGIGQSATPLSDGGELQLVSFEWLLPGFRSIDGSGLRPDVEVPPSASASPPRVSGMGDVDGDPVLRTALEVLRGVLGDDLAAPAPAPRPATVGPVLVPPALEPPDPPNGGDPGDDVDDGGDAGDADVPQPTDGGQRAGPLVSS